MVYFEHDMSTLDFGYNRSTYFLFLCRHHFAHWKAMLQLSADLGCSDKLVNTPGFLGGEEAGSRMIFLREGRAVGD